MTIGEKIKRIRQHRKMTQKELGNAVSLTANRIAQYEVGYRVPKDTLVEKFAEAMKVSTLAMKEPNTSNLFGIMETLLWLEEDIPGILMLTQIEKDSENPFDPHKPAWDAVLRGSAAVPPFMDPPVVLWSESEMLNRFFRAWGVKQKSRYTGQITKEEYFEWKICWPYSMEDGERYRNLADIS